ncbi:hypothetical protein [Hyphomicrobium sp. CS1GBMeth3]|uniref:hypothetical protein n=1 Tax=Hyphomicrobium sp. CS1GBMeth3 TaxID=1892845 RepID=UPI000930795C|nr:hypothetical protein [Hyphomicrobium sp. CS1GBMeth3]
MATPLAEGAFCYDETDSRARSYHVLWQIGAPLLLFPVLVFALATVWLVVGGTISQPAAWVIVVASAGAALSVSRLFVSDGWRFAPLLSLALGALALLLSGLVYDTSIDGQHYHFQAIHALVEGWNPYRDGAPPVIGDPVTLWAVHYPRGTWVVSATLLSAGLPLAAVKAVNFLVFFAGFALVAATLFRFGYAWAVAGLLAGIAVLSPIVTSQLFTSMNDGLLGLCMLMLVASMATWIHYRDPAALAAGLAAMVIGLNLKFSSIPIFAVLCLFICFGAFAARSLKAAVGVAAALLVTALVAVVLLGWSPYVQNVLHYGHVFYPVMGGQPVDIMFGNTPEVLDSLSAPSRFLYSLFAETHAGYETLAQLKLPFFLSVPELRAAGGVDVRIAGFGPLFSGVVVLALLCAGLLLWKVGRKTTAAVWLLLIAAGFLVSVPLMPQNWWARYVPQLWFVPLCIVAAALAVRVRSVQFLGLALAGVMLLDAAIVSGSATWLAAKRSAAASAQISDLARTGQTYCVYPDMVQSRIHVMRAAGLDVRYTPRDAISCVAPQEISGYGPDRFGGLICACP